jgi:hypothetical protein
MREQAARLNELSDREFKVLEQRARRVAERQGLALQRSKRRDPHAPDFGLYRLVDPNLNAVIAGARPWDFSMNLAEIVDWLLDDRPGKAA